MARVLVLVRQGCHLCDQALEVVSAVCAETGEGYTTQDIDADPELAQDGCTLLFSSNRAGSQSRDLWLSTVR